MSESPKATMEHIDHEKQGSVEHADETFKHIAGVNRRLVLLVMFSCTAAFTYGFSCVLAILR